MIRKSLLLILTILITASSSLQSQVPLIDGLKHPTKVYYSVFVQSFYDSNQDGIGDLNGLTSKLDYLKDLGIEGLWLLPVHPSPTYHKYDVTDYYGIHPDYGTLDDYKTLVKEAHKRNMVILLDLVANHTSNFHPWFINAQKKRPGPYRDYYLWSDQPADYELNPHQWHKPRNAKGVEQDKTRYYGFFWWEMPDLNYDNPTVRQEMIRIATYWLEEVGVDGFRLDAALHIYNEKEATKNHGWWKEFGKAVRAVKPDAMIVGEVWAPSTTIAPFLANGLSACFNFQLSDSIRKSLIDGIDRHIVETWQQIHRNYANENPQYQDAIFLTNHDMTRIMTELKGHTGKARVAAALLLTLPGNPFIYYGEEIGMLGDKPDEFIREPFLWDLDHQDPGQTTWEIPWLSNAGTVKPLAMQKSDEKSLYNYYKTLIHVRKQSPALQTGNLLLHDTNNPKTLAFVRTAESESILVLINLSNQTQSINTYPGINLLSPVYQSHDFLKTINGKTYLQPYSVHILSQKFK